MSYPKCSGVAMLAALRPWGGSLTTPNLAGAMGWPRATLATSRVACDHPMGGCGGHAPPPQDRWRETEASSVRWR